jgi:hypothetical protein
VVRIQQVNSGLYFPGKWHTLKAIQKTPEYDLEIDNEEAIPSVSVDTDNIHIPLEINLTLRHPRSSDINSDRIRSKQEMLDAFVFRKILKDHVVD